MDIFGSTKACLRSHSHSELAGALAQFVEVQFSASFLAPSSKPPDPQVLFYSLALILILHLGKEVVQDCTPWALRGEGPDILGSTGLC